MSFMNFPLTLNSLQFNEALKQESVSGFVRTALRSKTGERNKKKKMRKTAIKVANESSRRKTIVLRCCD